MRSATHSYYTAVCMKMYAWFRCFLYFDVFGGGEAGLTEDVLQAFLSLVLLHHIYVASCSIHACCVDSLLFDDLPLLSRAQWCRIYMFLLRNFHLLWTRRLKKNGTHIPRFRGKNYMMTFDWFEIRLGDIHSLAKACLTLYCGLAGPSTNTR